MVAAAFASEHGSFWDVGFAAGIVYNWWMVRTRNLWIASSPTPSPTALLAAYVVGAGQWQYWL